MLPHELSQQVGVLSLVLDIKMIRALCPYINRELRSAVKEPQKATTVRPGFGWFVAFLCFSSSFLSVGVLALTFLIAPCPPIIWRGVSLAKHRRQLSSLVALDRVMLMPSSWLILHIIDSPIKPDIHRVAHRNGRMGSHRAEGRWELLHVDA